MIDEATFRREADHALDSLKKSLIDAEEEGGFEAEENNGVLNILFEDRPGKVRPHPANSRPPALDLRPVHQLQT